MTITQETLAPELINSSSLYIETHLKGIIAGIDERPLGRRDDPGMEYTDYKLDLCHEALARQFRRKREALKLARIDLSVESPEQLAELEAGEHTAWDAVVNIQAFSKANSIAEFSEHKETGTKRDFYLPLIASGQRNEGIAIYERLWTHLGAYARELNEKTGTEANYVPDLTEGLSDHLHELSPFQTGKAGARIALLGRTSIHGSLQGTPDQPSMATLVLKQNKR